MSAVCAAMLSGLCGSISWGMHTADLCNSLHLVPDCVTVHTVQGEWQECQHSPILWKREGREEIDVVVQVFFPAPFPFSFLLFWLVLYLEICFPVCLFHTMLDSPPSQIKEKKKERNGILFSKAIFTVKDCNIVTFDFMAVTSSQWVRTSKPGEQEPETSPLVFSTPSMATCRLIVHVSMKKFDY